VTKEDIIIDIRSVTRLAIASIDRRASAIRLLVSESLGRLSLLVFGEHPLVR